MYIKTREEMNTDSLTRTDVSSSKRRRLRTAKRVTVHRLGQKSGHKPQQEPDGKAHSLTDRLTVGRKVV